MKLSGMIFVLLALLGVGGCGGDRIVEKPQFLARSVDFMEIKQIAFTEEGTVFTMDASACEGKLPAVSTEMYLVADGETYPLKEARGITLPGNAVGFTTIDMSNPTFELVFPALPAGTRTVDLVLLPSSKSLTLAIWGIRLDGERYDASGAVPEELKAWKPDNNHVWQKPVVRSGNTRLEIHWLGYSLDLGYPRVSRLGIHPWSGEVSVDKRGVSVVEFDQYVTATIELSLAGHTFHLVMDPGDQGVLYFDVARANMNYSPYFEKECEQFAYYQGGARTDLNNRLLNRDRKYVPSVAVRWSDGKELDAKQYGELCLKLYRERVADLEADGSLSPEYRRYRELEELVNCVGRFNRVRANMMTVYRCERMSDPRLPQLTEEMYAPLRDFNLNDKDLIMLGSEPLLEMFRNFKTEEGVRAYFGTGYLTDLYKAKGFPTRFDQGLPMNEEQLAAVQTATPEGKELFGLMYAGGQEAWKKHLAKPGYRVGEIPQVSNEKLFEAMMKPYRGQVVLIDYWYTACVPCVKAMKQIKPLKEEFKDEPVTYVYLTGEHSSPLEKWQYMIPDISGDHYRLPRKQCKYLEEQFKISGAPYYILVDKYGKVVYESLGFMGVDKLRELLKQELAK